MKKVARGGFSNWFGRAAERTAVVVGSPAAFILALVAIVVWIIGGPHYHYSNAWQLVINTGTTIITFLMVFVIQNTQNRDARALHLKLDEVIRAIRTAHNDMIDIESLSDSQLEELEKRYRKLRSNRQGSRGSK